MKGLNGWFATERRRAVMYDTRLKFFQPCLLLLLGVERGMLNNAI